ncbi:MAG: hypothetical protein ACYC1U_07895 [Candidatus Aquicultorales bacterium]
MPVQPTQYPWYIIWAQYFQIISAFILPIFLVGITVLAGLLVAKLNTIAKHLAPATADAGGSEVAKTDEGEDPDVSEYVE